MRIYLFIIGPKQQDQTIVFLSYKKNFFNGWDCVLWDIFARHMLMLFFFDENTYKEPDKKKWKTEEKQEIFFFSKLPDYYSLVQVAWRLASVRLVYFSQKEKKSWDHNSKNSKHNALCHNSYVLRT